VTAGPYPRRRRRRRRRGRTLVWLLAVALAFVLGIGLGEALHDDGPAAGTQTLIRTLQPLPLAPIASGTTTTVASNP
jgi:hypothetical protein